MSGLDYEVSALKKEILALKTQYQRQASQLRTVEYTVPLSFQLESYSGRIQSKYRAIIHTNTTQAKKGFITYRLDIPSIDSRTYITDKFDTLVLDKDNVEISVRIYDSRNSDDMSKISGGQTPVVNLNLIISSTVFLEEPYVEYI